MAPPILSFENLGLVQGEGWLFRGLDVHVGPRDRLALIGRNGAGKTTLLKCLAGMIDTDEGLRKIVPGTRVVMLEQDPVMSGHATLEDETADHALVVLRPDDHDVGDRRVGDPELGAAQHVTTRAPPRRSRAT